LVILTIIPPNPYGYRIYATTSHNQNIILCLGDGIPGDKI
jgi:hypothetical protein